MKKVIVTGANGFIGTELCERLSNENITIYGVLRQETSYTLQLQRLKNFVPIYCNMDNLQELAEKIKDDEIDVFYHLAWDGIDGTKRGDYNRQLKSIEWELEAVKIAKAMNCKRLIGAGSLAEYDTYAYSSMDGSTPNLVSFYGVAKMSAHFMSKALCNNIGIDHIWACIGNTYGTNDESGNFVNYALNIIQSDEDADFTAGEQVYDFVHVSDVANALYLIGEKGRKNVSYYIGSEHPRKLKEYIIELKNILNPEKQLNLGKIPFHGVAHPIELFDCSKLCKDTGYHAEISFKDGIRNIIDSKLGENKFNV